MNVISLRFLHPFNADMPLYAIIFDLPAATGIVTYTFDVDKYPLIEKFINSFDAVFTE